MNSFVSPALSWSFMKVILLHKTIVVVFFFDSFKIKILYQCKLKRCICNAINKHTKYTGVKHLYTIREKYHRYTHAIHSRTSQLEITEEYHHITHRKSSLSAACLHPLYVCTLYMICALHKKIKLNATILFQQKGEKAHNSFIKLFNKRLIFHFVFFFFFFFSQCFYLYIFLLSTDLFL